MKQYRVGQIIILHKYKYSHSNRLKKARTKVRLGLWKRIYPDEWDLRTVQVYKVLSAMTIKEKKKELEIQNEM